MQQDFAAMIKERVTMPEVLATYGYKTNRGRRIPCPIHNGTDNNFSYNDSVYYCFVCGAKGDVITFVQKIFDIDFSAAIVRINEDFHLGLPLERKMTLREKYAAQEFTERKAREKAAAEAEEKAIRKEYQDALSVWIDLDQLRRMYRPKRQDEPLHPLFVKAIMGIDRAEYRLEQAELRLYAYEHR